MAEKKGVGIDGAENEKEIIWAESVRVNFSGLIQSTGEEDNFLSEY